jgi:WD40 repeat protein
MDNQRVAHPTPENLTAFGLGRMSDEDSVAVERHLAECATCRRLLETLPNDSWVERLRAAAGSVTPPATDPGKPHEAATLTPSPGSGSGTGPAPALNDHPRYRVVKLLGAGGMGAVYQAEHRVMERAVALKVISPGLVENPDAVARFQREVKAAAKLAHPNIVTAFDAEQAGDTHFLVMEYVEGTTLAEVIARKGPLPVAHACNYIRQAALGLQHAHQLGMVHRDIKPHNLMLTRQGRIKILDFGLARLASEQVPAQALTEANKMMGTPDYVAPEQANDARSADIRADIYSLGCTLYCLLTGRPPFADAPLMQKLLSHFERTPPPVSGFRTDVPAELARVLDRMMAKDPAARYQTPAEVALALAPFAKAVPGPARELVPQPARATAADEPTEAMAAPTPPARPPRRRLVLVAAAVLMTAAAVCAGIVLKIQTGKGELLIESADDDVTVEIKQGGKVVTIHDTKTGHKLELGPGEYEITLKDGPPNLTLVPSQFTLRRGDKEIAKVTRVAPPPGAPAEAAEGELVFEAAGAEAPVRVSQGGKVVLTHDPRTGAKVRLKAGEYELALADAPPGLRLSPERVTLPRGGSVVVNITRAAGAASKGDGPPILRAAGVFAGHQAPVRSVALSPDDSLALSGGGHEPEDKSGPGPSDFSVRLWDVVGGKELHRFTGHAAHVHDVAFSPTARLAVSSSQDCSVRVYDLDARKELGHMSLPPWRAAHCVLFLPDGRLLTGGEFSSVKLWDVQTRKLLKPDAYTGHAKGVVFAMAATPDGRRILSGGDTDARGLRLWDADTQKELSLASEKLEGGINAVAISPDGQRGLSGGGDHALRLWDLTTGRQEWVQWTHAGPVWCVAFTPDGRHVLCGNKDGRLRLWEAQKGKLLYQFEGHTGDVNSLAVSSDGRFCLTGSRDGTVRRWNLPEPTWPRDGRLAVAADALAVAVLVKRGGQVKTTLGPRGSRAVELPPGTYALELARPDPGLRLSATRVTIRPNGREVIQIQPTPTALPAKLPEVLTGQGGRILCVAFSPDGKRLFSGSSDGSVWLWEVATGKILAQNLHNGTGMWVNNLALSEDGSVLACAIPDLVRTWDAQARKPLHMLRGHKGQVKAVAVSADGRFLVSTGVDKTLRRWGPQGLLRTAETPGVIESVVLLSDGRRGLLGGQDKLLRLWDTTNGQELRVFPARHTEAIRSVAVSADDRVAVTGSEDGSIAVWDVPGGKFVRGGEKTHRGWVTSVALSRDGRRALSGSFDYTVRLWDVATGKIREQFNGHTDAVQGVALSPDGTLAASACKDGTVRLWKLPPP